jgi:hypothetical protein
VHKVNKVHKMVLDEVAVGAALVRRWCCGYSGANPFSLRWEERRLKT